MSGIHVNIIFIFSVFFLILLEMSIEAFEIGTFCGKRPNLRNLIKRKCPNNRF